MFSHIVTKQVADTSPSKTPWIKIVNTQDEWQQLLLLWQDDFNPPVRAPEFDFEQYQLITGGFGEKPSGGYSIVVDRVDEHDDAIYISVLNISPGPECLVTMALSRPAITILIKKSNKPIKFSITELEKKCPSS